MNVFESFRILDRHLTTINTQLHDLQREVESGRSHKSKPSEWRNTARAMRQTSAKIQHLSAVMQAHFRRQKRKLGVKLFGSLRKEAKIVDRQLISLSQTQAQSSARKDLKKVEASMLNLLLKFQSLSGGYAASHCGVKEWNCGVAKQDVNHQQFGIRWTCVTRSTSCHGILGPRTLGVVSEPLTSPVTKTN
jgi:hypothetical protein